MKRTFVLSVLAMLVAVASGASADAVDTLRANPGASRADDAATARARSEEAAAAAGVGTSGMYRGRGYINVDGYYMAFGNQLPSDRRNSYSGYACAYKGSRGTDGATRVDLSWWGPEAVIEVQWNGFSWGPDYGYQWYVTVLGKEDSDMLDGAFRVAGFDGWGSRAYWTMRPHPSKGGAMTLQLTDNKDYWGSNAEGLFIALGPDRDASTKYLILTDDVNAAATVTIDR